ncbi:MAG TPA: hypothetical protein VFH54_04705, partial [Mycobacteriales bacterium]|nr:hypothetical protein [Mycobacteriales bacterium]
MFDIGIRDYGTQPSELDDPDWIDQAIANDPGDGRPAEVLAGLAPIDEEPARRSLAELLDEVEHGPVTPVLFTELTRVSALALDDDERVAVMIGWQRYEAHCVGQKLTAIARFAGPTPAGAGDTGAAAFAWTEIGAALSVGEG